MAVTYALIINADSKTADVFKLDGWHKYAGWNTTNKQGAYLTTVDFKVLPVPTTRNIAGSR